MCFRAIGKVLSFAETEYFDVVGMCYSGSGYPIDVVFFELTALLDVLEGLLDIPFSVFSVPQVANM